MANLQNIEATIASTVSNLTNNAYSLYEGIVNPTAPVKATFTKLKAPSIPRSSHTVNVVGNKAYIFGGEISPREPVDNAMHVITLPGAETDEGKYETIEAKAEGGGEVPTARVGHSSTSIGSTIYIHGGRGGPSMSALPEDSRIWAFSTITRTWTALDAPPDTPRPETRSYHTMASTPFPGPEKTAGGSAGEINVANVLTGDTPNPATDLKGIKENSYGTILLSSGCLSSGGRTSDLWSFDLSSLTWAQMPSAPEPGRGGSSLSVIKDRLYRFGGFDGKTELGGQIDVLDLNLADEFNDQGGAGIMAVSPRGDWRKILISPEADRDGKGGNKLGPTDRSVAGLVPVRTVGGREYLLIIAGEGKASDQGHAGAGKFLEDVWSFEVKPAQETVAGMVDQIKEAAGAATIEEGTCTEVEYFLAGEKGDKMEVQSSESKPMGRRGWFDACEAGNGRVLIWGGVGEDNVRIGDGWLISVE